MREYKCALLASILVLAFSAASVPRCSGRLLLGGDHPHNRLLLLSSKPCRALSFWIRDVVQRVCPPSTSFHREPTGMIS